MLGGKLSQGTSTACLRALLNTACTKYFPYYCSIGLLLNMALHQVFSPLLFYKSAFNVFPH
jgi:hypothetical protein